MLVSSYMSASGGSEPDLRKLAESLAEHFNLPVDDVLKLYARERAELAEGVRIRDFLHIFALRKVQQILSSRNGAK